MDRKIKIKKRAQIEKILGITANPEKVKIMKSLKGYSEFTNEIENRLFKDDLEMSWLLLGRLIINDVKLTDINDATFFKDSKNYFIIRNQENVDKFFEYANSIYLKDTAEKIDKKEEEVNKNVDDFYEISKLSPEIIDKKLINDFLNCKDNYTQCSSLYALIKILEENQEMKKTDLYKGLGIKSKKAGICLYRYELFKRFKGKEALIKKIEKAKDNPIQKIKEKTIEDQNKLLDEINKL